MRVLIADDHPLMLAGLRRALAEADRFDIVAEATTCAAVLTAIDRVRPDVAVVDLGMPGMDGITLLDRMLAKHSALKVVVLSESSDPELVEQAFKHGACSFVVKTIDTTDLVPAIKQGIDGTAFHASGLPALAADSAASKMGISDQELRVLREVARGLSNQMVADKLFVTEQTVKFHMTNIFRKLGVANRTEAARWVFAHGLVGEPEPEAADSGRRTGR